MVVVVVGGVEKAIGSSSKKAQAHDAYIASGLDQGS